MDSLVRVESLGLRFGAQVVLQGIDFRIRRGEVLAIAGPSGCGKSTLLRHLAGLREPSEGRVLYRDGAAEADIHHCDDETLARLRRRFGVMFQGGALWGSMSVGENLMLGLRLFSRLPRAVMEQRARFKLDLVGLRDCFDELPETLSGGMRKRAAIARALMLNPELLYLDEPASGLDPGNAARLDALILGLRQYLGTTVVLVTHSVDSILAVADRMLFLDDESKTMMALDTPRALLDHGPERVRAFLHRAGTP